MSTEKELMEKIIRLQAEEIAALKDLVAAQKEQLTTLNKMSDNHKEIIRIQKEIIEELKSQQEGGDDIVPPTSFLN